MKRTQNLIALLTISLSILSAGNLHAGQIHDAAAAGDLEKVKALIEADPSLLESKNEDGYTPLMSACFGMQPNYITQVEVANYLIDKGANVKAKCNEGGNALTNAVHRIHEGEFDLIQRLISLGADVNAGYMGIYTALGSVAVSGNTEIAKLLIDNGADMNFKQIDGTYLQMAINNSIPFNDDIAIEHKLNEAMATLLVEKGAKLQEFSFGNTELHLAAIRGFSNLVPVLVKHGADVNAMNDYGHTPLFYAARHGHRKTAEALIAAGANESSIVETNYGKASQFDEKLKEGEAYLWYLASPISPNTGYAVKTKNHLLILNPSRINESQEAGLANGYINPKELIGQKITMLTSTHPHPRFGQDILSKLLQTIPDANFLLCAAPHANEEDNIEMPPYHLVTAYKNFSVDGIQVHTIPTCQRLFGQEGFGYLIEVDGLKFFHAGVHAASSNRDSQVEKYRKEIDFLKSYGPIDFAILPISVRHISVAYQQYLYLIDQLAPKAIYLLGEAVPNEEHRKCLEVLRARNVPVEYPDGGIAIGQRFHYLAPDAQEFTDLKGDYLGQTPPGDTPVVFAPGKICLENRYEQNSTFTPDGNEFCFSVTNASWSWTNTWYTKQEQGHWTEPKPAVFTGSGDVWCPHFSPNGEGFYFVSTRLSYPPSNIWKCEKTPDGWSAPVKLDSPVSSSRDEWGFSVMPDKSIYLCSHRSGGSGGCDIWYCHYENGQYVAAENIAILNTTSNDCAPYVPPDQNFLVFNSDKPGGYGSADLYISYRLEDGSWTAPRNLGPNINTSDIELGFSLSPDGKYCFFTRRTNNDSDIYWVDAKAILSDPNGPGFSHRFGQRPGLNTHHGLHAVSGKTDRSHHLRVGSDHHHRHGPISLLHPRSPCGEGRSDGGAEI